MPDYRFLELPTIVDKMPSEYEVYLEYGAEHFGFAMKQIFRTYLRTVLAERQNHKCCYCGLPMNDIPNSRRKVSVEHVIPQSRGGKWDLWNCVAAHSRCNTKRSDKPIPEESLVLLDVADDYQCVVPYQIPVDTVSDPL